MKNPSIIRSTISEKEAGDLRVLKILKYLKYLPLIKGGSEYSTNFLQDLYGMYASKGDKFKEYEKEVKISIKMIEEGFDK